MPVTFNYNNPSVPFVINGRSDPTSQRFHVSAAIVLLEKLCAVSESEFRTRARSHSTSPFQLLHPSISSSSGLFCRNVSQLLTIYFFTPNRKVAIGEDLQLTFDSCICG
jgi:hypothetical protein